MTTSGNPASYSATLSDQARYEAVGAWIGGVTLPPLRERAIRKNATVEEVGRYRDRQDAITGAFSTVYLLKALQEHAPQVAEEVAERLRLLLADGSSVPEMLVEWLREWGIDPDEVAKLAKQPRQEAA